jgi:hypothetical protein
MSFADANNYQKTEENSDKRFSLNPDHIRAKNDTIEEDNDD